MHAAIKSSLPKYALKKYQKMMDVIESSLNMAYDPMTRALTIEGIPVENTNIVDLVVESLRRKNSSPKIAGWKAFTSQLKKAGGTSSILGNKHQKQYMTGSGANHSRVAHPPASVLKHMLAQQHHCKAIKISKVN